MVLVSTLLLLDLLEVFKPTVCFRRPQPSVKDTFFVQGSKFLECKSISLSRGNVTARTVSKLRYTLKQIQRRIDIATIRVRCAKCETKIQRLEGIASCGCDLNREEQRLVNEVCFTDFASCFGDPVYDKRFVVELEQKINESCTLVFCVSDWF